MAVYHCHTHAIGRSGKSGSALACAAYRSGEKLRERDGLEARERRALSAAELAAYRTGEAVADGSGKVHDYTRKGGVTHAEIVLPKGVTADWARDREALWNAAERADTRKNSRLAREWRIALPYELAHDERVALARDFAERIVERYGVAADVAVHAPSRSGDQRNWHAHVLCTTRQVTNEGFGAKAEIEWSNTNCKKAGLPYTSVQIREMRLLWEECANEHLAQAGREQRIDHRSYAEQGIALEATRTVHVGQVYAEDRDAVQGTERILPVERLDREASARNAEAIAEQPSLLLDRIARSEAVFTRHDVARSLHRYVNEDMDRFERTLNAVMGSDELVCLMEAGRTADTGREVEAVWTTREVATREAVMLDRAERMARSQEGGLSERAIGWGLATAEGSGRGLTLTDEQRAAVRTLGSEGRLAILRGVAGTGKTTALSAFRAAAEADGVRVTGAALAGKAARELEDGSGIESRTLASLERSWGLGFDALGRGDVLVVDEAGMVGSAQMARVLAHVEEAGAKIVLVGDERQLQPIEAGAAFRNVKERVAEVAEATEQANGAQKRTRTFERASTGTERTTPIAELTEVRRQSATWQREASEAFGRGEAGAALDAYRERGEVRLHDSTEQTHAAIVRDYFRHRDAARGIGTAAIEAAAGRTGERTDERAAEATASPTPPARGSERGAGGRLRSAMRARMSFLGLGGSRDAIRTNEAVSGSAAPSGRQEAPERTLAREPDHIVTAYRNADVDALNEAIRAKRVARGELADGASFRTDRGRAEFARGDHVLLTANDREIGVANGDRGIVLVASDDRLAIRTRDGREVAIDAERYGGVRHGYAVTTHRAQGMTVDRVHVMAGRGMDAPLAYVAMTRQREGATLHASRDHFRDYATLRESVSRERQSRGVADYLAREAADGSGTQRGALASVRERIEATERARAAEKAQDRAEARERNAQQPVRNAAQRPLERGSKQASGDIRMERLRAKVREQSDRSREPDAERIARLRETVRAASAPLADRDRDATHVGGRAAAHDHPPYPSPNREHPLNPRATDAERIGNATERPDVREALKQRLRDHAAGRTERRGTDDERRDDLRRRIAGHDAERTGDRSRTSNDRSAARDRGSGHDDGAGR